MSYEADSPRVSRLSVVMPSNTVPPITFHNTQNIDIDIILNNKCLYLNLWLSQFTHASYLQAELQCAAHVWELKPKYIFF